jgi:hypothetical protein
VVRIDSSSGRSRIGVGFLTVDESEEIFLFWAALRVFWSGSTFITGANELTTFFVFLVFYSVLSMGVEN